MLKYTLCALGVFVASSIWLVITMMQGYSTQDWQPVPAQIEQSETAKNLSGRSKSVRTTVTYMIGGETYTRDVDDFLVGGSGTVYVNPEDPSQVVGERGPNLQHYGRPMIIAITSGIFLIALGLIALSPKED